MKLGFVNLVAAADAVSASSSASGYPAANVQTPQRPFLPWRSTATTEQWVKVDFGDPTSLEVVAPIHANVTTLTVQGHATDVWTSPSYSVALTIGRNPWNRRYQAAQLPVGFNYRYLRLLIGAQTPVDGAAYFSLGGLWAGTLDEAPRDIRYEYEIETLEPRVDIQPDHGGWRERLTLGEPLTRLLAHRVALVSEDSPAGLGDELEDWLDYDRQMGVSDYVLTLLERGSARHVWVARRLSTPTWRVARPLATSDIEFEEVLGP